MISVVIPLYNKEANIRHTINSVLNQAFTDFELVVVNDGSTDNSAGIVESLTDERIKLIYKKNGGVSSARNIGFQAAKYNYVSFLDGDDLWTTDHLEEVVRMVDKYGGDSDVVAFASKYKKFRGPISEISLNKTYDKRINKIEDYYKVAYTKSLIYPSSCTIVKNRFNMSTLFREDLKIGEDTELWTRLFETDKLVYSEKTTVIYYVEGDNRAMNSITPLEKRYHNFNFQTKNLSKLKYLNKLAAVVILDYFMYGDYKAVVFLIKKYRRSLKGILSYFSYKLKIKYL